MPKPEWGVKRVCPTTGKRFYDLGRDPVVSPYTGEVVNLDTGKASRTLIKEEKAKPKAKDTVIEDDDAVLEDDSESSDVDLGDDILDEDADDNVSLDDIADMSSEDEDN